MGRGRYRIGTSPERIVPIGRLKPYIPALQDGKEKSAPCGWFAPSASEPPHDDTWTVEKILGTRKTKVPGQAKNVLQWHVQWKFGDKTWETRDQFLNGINTIWKDYNNSHKINPYEGL